MNFNENYHLDGHDLTALFDKTFPAIGFADPVRKHIPNSGSIIYSVWDKNGSFIYIGIAGTQKAFEKRSPLRRMQTHASGRRSGDQFNIYVHDFYVIPNSIESGVFHFEKGILDKLTKKHIQKNLSYRFVHFQSEESGMIVTELERLVKSGVFGFEPLLNGD